MSLIQPPPPSSPRSPFLELCLFLLLLLGSPPESEECFLSKLQTIRHTDYTISVGCKPFFLWLAVLLNSVSIGMALTQMRTAGSATKSP